MEDNMCKELATLYGAYAAEGFNIALIQEYEATILGLMYNVCVASAQTQNEAAYKMVALTTAVTKFGHNVQTGIYDKEIEALPAEQANG
jgi:hypothetical protein